MVYSNKFFQSPQDQLAHDVYGLSDEDAEIVLALVDRLFDDSDEEPLTDDEIAALYEAHEHRDDPSYWVTWDAEKGVWEECE